MSELLAQKRAELDELRLMWKAGEPHLKSKVRQAYCDWFHQAAIEGAAPDRLDFYIEDEVERFFSKLLSGLDGHVYWHREKPKSRFRKNDGTDRLPALYWWEFVHGDLNSTEHVHPVCGDDKCINPFHSKKTNWLADQVYWTQDKCVNAIKVAVMKLGITHGPTVVQYRELKMNPTDQTIRARFGSWEKAIEAAGFPYNKFASISATKEDCYAGIIFLYEMLSRTPTQQDIRASQRFLKEAGLPASHQTYRKYMGSGRTWNKRVKEALSGSKRQIRK